MRKHIERIDKSLGILFTLIFGTVPLAMHPLTSELFELNKMWLVWIYSLLVFFLWGSKMLILKKIVIRRTFFDIPILLFLLSQILSTIFSMDPHVSIWGYYSRFNGGLLSTIAYIFLYYAFASNILTDGSKEQKGEFNPYLFGGGVLTFLIGVFLGAQMNPTQNPALGGTQTFVLLTTIISTFTLFHFAFNLEPVKKALSIFITSGFLVALWGLPSHFGYDPTCYIFRGSLDVSCWTEAFQPKIRMFSTLGQPNWLATFLAILLPILMAFIVDRVRSLKKSDLLSFNSLALGSFLLTAILFYIDLGWTLSQSGFIAFWAGSFVFFIIYIFLLFHKNQTKNSESKNFASAFILTLKQKTFIAVVLLNILFLLTTFFTVNPIPRLQGFSFSSLMQKAQEKPQQATKTETQTEDTTQLNPLDASITASGDIRKIVWKGAFEIFKENPIFGSGVDTFAYAYYKHRPVEHNLTSEWNYLYNKAHSEHINYLATTGIFGLGTYLAIAAAFLFYAFKTFYKNFRKNVIGSPILPALVGSYFAIHISNFFGFSVVNVNLLLFLIPLFFFELVEKNVKYLVFPKDAKEDYVPSEISTGQIMGMVIFAIVAIFNIIFLINNWVADISYAQGVGYQSYNEYATANQHLEKAVSLRPGEDLFQNDLSVNLAAIALSFAEQKDEKNTVHFAQRAKEISDGVVKRNPNNIVYWKTRTRVMFSLATLNSSLIPEVVKSIETAHKLAPTDAHVMYNQALIYNQIGQSEKAISIINDTIKIRPNYRDAYYAKALFYSKMIENDPKSAKAPEYRQKAIESLNYSLKNVNSNDSQAEELLKTLNK